MKAWHFTNGKLRDGSPVPTIGEKLSFNGKIEICRSGLHASARLIDALKYAPGHILHRVNLNGDLIRQNDKMVGRERTIVWSIDARSLLRDFARRCALDVVHLWAAPDSVIKYLKTGDGSLQRQVYSAAAAAAADAAYAAAAGAANAAAYAANAAAGAYAANAAAYAANAAAGAANAGARAASYAAYAAAAAAYAAAVCAADSSARAAPECGIINNFYGKLNQRLTAMAVAAHKREV